MDKQNFQSSGFQFYDAMKFVIPSTAQGHASFRGTRSNYTKPALDDNEDTPGVFSFVIMTISILIPASQIFLRPLNQVTTFHS
jgi:hypothetical protein